jgi:malyl-CoA/(S)-citramalyl-CoA lyase
MGRKKRIGFELIIETALGMANVDAIAKAPAAQREPAFRRRRLRRLDPGAHHHDRRPQPDYGVLTDPNAEGERDYHWGDMWHYAIARMVVAARAHGLRPIDGPFGDFSDPEGFRAQARRAAVLGCEGKWAIHPSQIDLANEVMGPSEGRGRQGASASSRPWSGDQKEGKGAVALDGRLIDIASIKQAEVMVKGKARNEGRCLRPAGTAPLIPAPLCGIWERRSPSGGRFRWLTLGVPRSKVCVR